MAHDRIIALLSDFGLQDIYVGVIKGAIAKIAPQLKVIDLTHQIPPQNIVAGRFCLMEAFPYFPAETVFVAVVDPGVGTQRRGIAVQFGRGYLVGPDNGLFSGVLSLSPPLAAVELTNPYYWLSFDPSFTFHGRDIFAPVGAHLASGLSLERLGTPIDPASLVELPLAFFKMTETSIIGAIQHIDVFGNLITNIPATAVEDKRWSVAIANSIVPSGRTYSDANTGETIALLGSHGWVEIAVNGGNAKAQLQVEWGDLVEIVYQPII
ncbi:MAG: SAM-dependent chlorinase/fluorinase [Hydrococcus sp. RU_2_2]|jgi:S-adenosyl-L-methionine hydrolase (adenosine-forming)|nr:SAM-dependent chlorinase/fluorinase [Hydrococcus sp. RU_2_2]NJP21440.1 SAM-dependent chlorinase/fluorinase [Hydrococcus sp. CRU_1_1]